MNPLFQFSKRLASKGLKVTLVTTIFIAKTMKSHPGSLIVDPISDGLNDGGIVEARDINICLKRFEAVGSRNLAELVKKHSHGCPVKCLIYDSHIPWALDVAKRLGIVGASFFTQYCAVDLIYYNVGRGLLSTPVQGPTVTIPGLPLLEVNDLPSFVYFALGLYAILLGLLSQFSNFEKADCLLFNTFDKLEDEWDSELVHEKGIVRREDIELCIKEVMEGEKGKVFKRNVKKWKEMAKEAVDEGGSSDKNIEEFIAGLLCE
ncbi:hypothetical protein HHK36_020023 [Tetracentron sinense]|uniref:Uncharacterized protein n=1 Tax=Tetracentron sinense TaxID=13715 RepID=A0A834YUS9_TETSI|nr:hypothetical protein HHK36_020023 [Tetracentron sinense]